MSRKVENPKELAAGEIGEYHRGYLPIDRLTVLGEDGKYRRYRNASDLVEITEDEATEMRHLNDRAETFFAAAVIRNVELTQRKLGTFNYSYLARRIGR